MATKLRLHAAPATAVSLAMILALAVAGLVTLSGAEAANQQLSCGDTITADTTLHHNLANCPNNGLIIGADNVTLDLNYHTIDGDGTEFAACHPRKEFCDVGVINDGNDGVTVVHGSVRQFDVGVLVGEARHNRLLGISSSGNRFAGLGFFASTRSLMRNSSGRGSTSRENGTGMFLADSHHVRILHNSFRHNGDQGIYAPESSHNLIKGNVLSGNRTAMSIEGGDRNQVRGNRASRNGNGIAIDGDRNIIRGNRVSGPRGFGIPLERGDHNLIARNSVRDTHRSAISVGFEPGADNVVRRNRIRGAGEAGVLVDSRGKRTLLLGNHIRRAGGDGVHVDDNAKHTLLRRNHAFGSKDDGLDVNNPKTKVTRNEARRNGDLGIEAVRGVIDGGGNKASGNGDLRQCTNIVCS